MKILSASQISLADDVTVSNQQIASIDLMERAAGAFVEAFMKDFATFANLIHIFCGPGNNGGDGLAIGRILIEFGLKVKIYAIGNSKSKDFLINRKRLSDINIPLMPFHDDTTIYIAPDDLIIDAIFGIGLNRNPTGNFKRAINILNNSRAIICSVDIPSGLFAEKAVTDKESVVKADIVFTFQMPKFAFFLPDSSEFIKDFKIIDIGLDEDFIESSPHLAQIITHSQAKALLRKRNKFGHKGTFGHLGVVGGSFGKIGSIILSSKAAFRTGAGMVTAIVPKCGYEIVQTAIPEVMTITDSSENDLESAIVPDFIDCLAVGMGMGTSEKAQSFLENLLRIQNRPILIDADGLNCLAKNSWLLNLIPKNSVLTPHPKELERLIGKWDDDFQKIEKARSFSVKYSVVVLIKGAYSMTIYHDSIYINSTGNPGMATAGSGDTLSGIIAGLLAQGYDSLSATVLGTYIHGMAGDLAASEGDENSVMAGDLIEYLPRVFKILRK